MKPSASNKQTAEQFFSRTAISAADIAGMQQESVFAGSLEEQVSSLHLHNISQRTKSKHPMQHKGLLKGKGLLLAGFSLVALIAALSVIILTKQNPATPDKLGASVALAEGNVEYASGDYGWKAATADLNLQEGDSVRVLGEGRAVINLDDGSAVRIDSDSEITLTSLSPQAIVISNNQGSVYTRVVAMERSFDVVAGDFTYSSLGTAYKTVNLDSKNGVEVYQSKVKVNGTPEEQTVEEGKSFYAYLKDNPDKEKQLLDLSLEEVQKDDFVVWNKQQDEQNPEFKDKLGVLNYVDAPKLEVTSPADGFTTKEEKVKVAGSTEAGNRIFVNGTEVTVNGETFETEIALATGENVITVMAKNAGGIKQTVTRKVVREAEVQATPKPTTQTTASGISLSGVKVDSGIKLTWTVNGLNTGNGFKIVKSLSANPVYPGNDATYVDGSKRAYTLGVQDGKTYNIRICIYNGNGGCSNYSNNISVKAPSAPENNVSSISLQSLGGGSVKWVTSGYAAQGFKLVWSKTSGPTYPKRDGDSASYYDNPASNQGSVDAFDGAGTYFVRVCQYKNGVCGTYSNEISVDL